MDGIGFWAKDEGFKAADFKKKASCWSRISRNLSGIKQPSITLVLSILTAPLAKAQESGDKPWCYDTIKQLEGSIAEAQASYDEAKAMGLVYDLSGALLLVPLVCVVGCMIWKYRNKET